MRQIKFRGKDLNTGEWIEGFPFPLYHNQEGRHKSPHWLFIPKDANISKLRCIGSIQVEVEPNTIGQFTGLKDKNGREIYEGDIIRKTETTFRMTDLGAVRYCNEEAKFVLHVTDEYREYDLSFVKDFQSQDGYATVPCHNEYEVVGNIYDNPELLKQ